MKILRNQNYAENPIRTVRSEDKNKVREKVLVARNITRQGRTRGRMEAAGCHTGDKGQSKNGFQQDLCSSAPSNQRNNVETWGGLCSKTAPQEALYLSGFTHFTLQKKRLNLIQHQALPRLRSDTQVYSRGPTCLPSCLNI